MIIPEIAVAVNSEPDNTLNELLYAMDYKMYGTESPVYADKDKLHQAYMTWYAVNSNYYKEALEYANSINKVGQALWKIGTVKALPEIKQYRNFTEISMSKDERIIRALNDTDGVLHFLVNDGFIAEIALSAEEIKQMYFDDNITNCDSRFPQVIFNNYADYFTENYEQAMELFTKDSFWNVQNWYQGSSEWCNKLVLNFRNLYAVHTANVPTSTSKISSSGMSENTSDSKYLTLDNPVFLLSQRTFGNIDLSGIAWSNQSGYGYIRSSPNDPYFRRGSTRDPASFDSTKIMVSPNFRSASVSTYASATGSNSGTVITTTTGNSIIEYVNMPPETKS